MLLCPQNLNMCKYLIPVFLSLFPGAYSRLCHVTSLLLENPLSKGSNKTDTLMYQCPQPGDPHTFTDCCFAEETENPEICCESRNVGFLPGLDDEMLIIVSIGVIIACLLSSITVLICCFWSKCPLHSSCSVDYKHKEAIAFSTKEERMKLNGMPDEEYRDHKSHAVKIRPVADV